MSDMKQIVGASPRAQHQAVSQKSNIVGASTPRNGVQADQMSSRNPLFAQYLSKDDLEQLLQKDPSEIQVAAMLAARKQVSTVGKVGNVLTLAEDGRVIATDERYFSDSSSDEEYSDLEDEFDDDENAIAYKPSMQSETVAAASSMPSMSKPIKQESDDDLFVHSTPRHARHVSQSASPSTPRMQGLKLQSSASSKKAKRDEQIATPGKRQASESPPAKTPLKKYKTGDQPQLLSMFPTAGSVLSTPHKVVHKSGSSIKSVKQQTMLSPMINPSPSPLARGEAAQDTPVKKKTDYTRKWTNSEKQRLLNVIADGTKFAEHAKFAPCNTSLDPAHAGTGSYHAWLRMVIQAKKVLSSQGKDISVFDGKCPSVELMKRRAKKVAEALGFQVPTTSDSD